MTKWRRIGTGCRAAERRWRHRALVHKFMRLAYAEGATYIVEDLEAHREHVAAQLSYTIQDHERKRESRRAVQGEG